MERSNDDWLFALRGTADEQALLDLRTLLVRGLGFALADRLPADPAVALEDFVQDALLKILRSLDTFRGDSRFTTWAQKIAVRVALTELRRRHWQNVSLEDLTPEESDYMPLDLSDPTPSPEMLITRASVMALVQQMIREELTDRQQQAMMAVMIGGMPLKEVAHRLGTNRNALYKLLHDSRQRLQKRLAAQGLSVQNMLAALDDQ